MKRSKALQSLILLTLSIQIAVGGTQTFAYEQHSEETETFFDAPEEPNTEIYFESKEFAPGVLSKLKSIYQKVNEKKIAIGDENAIDLEKEVEELAKKGPLAAKTIEIIELLYLMSMSNGEGLGPEDAQRFAVFKDECQVISEEKCKTLIRDALGIKEYMNVPDSLKLFIRATERLVSMSNHFAGKTVENWPPESNIYHFMNYVTVAALFWISWAPAENWESPSCQILFDPALAIVRFLYFELLSHYVRFEHSYRLLVAMAKAGYFMANERTPVMMEELEVTYGLKHLKDISKYAVDSRNMFYRAPMNDTCAICFDGFENGDSVVTPCKHGSHEKCLSEWIKASRADKPMCPYCNTEIKLPRGP